ncbi:beta-L-arabinofuranosidase domain-containing protein [Saccharothrix longispora]|uniref:glycoside hydrolase family 127 protein n=1 Tax=Saccharothrix longispora TaxID=33920 RepID=UPI0028FD85A0|nr:beta-L-arabinofuranosidase domain-containing protein [Saccharothrix longispora]MDU0287938.1 glycoside hydrolase family 127 protein [Saccharothrix longispora]
MSLPTPSRRAVLRAGAVLAATAGATATGAAPGLAAARPDVGTSADPFPLGAVALHAGPFRSNTNRTHAYLRFLDADRLLHTFRLNVGLPSGATPCGGWESPTTELRGHTTGHVLTALAQAYASTGDTAFKAKSDHLVAQLATCQDRATAAGYNTGYLSAFPESFIDRVEARQQVWAPYYTLHKILAGLLDAHLLTGNAQALTVLTRMAGWVAWRNGRLTPSQRQDMLDTEFGGMNEVLADLYQLTGDPAHLAAARHFDHAEVFDPLAQGRDALDGYHANTQIPKALGAIREYHATGETRYRDIATFFWDTVVGAHTYAIGGNSNGEYFKAPDRIASELSDHTCECCNTYNMLKLTRQLFRTHPGRPELFDFHEKALYNHLLGAQDPDSAHGHHSYYVPLRAGGQRTYSNDYQNFTCCHGTGMETNTKHGDSIYFHGGNTLWVNLFIPSTLTWPGRGLTVRQDTGWPETPSTKLTVTGTGPIDLRLRVPSWATGARLRLNGTPVAATPGGYARLDRTWTSGDVVELSLPMTLTRESTPDNPAVQAVKHGPIVLAGWYGTTDPGTTPTLRPDTIRATTTPLRYTATASTGQVTLAPFHQTHRQRYTVYWNVTGTPAPAFIAHYPFDEGSGTTAADATGGGRTATLVDAAWTTGRTGSAVELNGTSGHVVLPAGLLAGATAFSVATWVRLDALTTWARVFDFGTGTGGYLFLTPRSSAGGVRYAVTTGGSGAEQRIDAANPLPTGAWTHVAVTQAGDLGVLYVNGAEVARNTALTLRPASLGSTAQNRIGRSQYANDPYLDGAVDGFRLHGRALSAAEVADLHATGR